MQLHPLRACLTAGQPELILTYLDHFLNLGFQEQAPENVR